MVASVPELVIRIISTLGKRSSPPGQIDLGGGRGAVAGAAAGRLADRLDDRRVRVPEDQRPQEQTQST